MSDHLLVGLGNPGKEHEATRHNFGFLTAVCFARSCGIKLVRSAKYRSLIGSGEVDGLKIDIALPMTFMNASGSAVKAIVKSKEIALNNMLVVCDDLNLEFGDMRLRSKGSAGGHNGLASVIKELHSEEFPRLRLGIGSPHAKGEVTDFVLSGFKAHERKRLDEIITRAADCCRSFFTCGISETTACFNKRSRKEEHI